MTTEAAAEVPRSLRAWLQPSWSRPEYGLIALSVLAWLLLFREHGSWPPISFASGHEHHHHVPASPESSRFFASLLAEVKNWGLMLVAVMAPMVLAPARITTDRSLWHRRGRAVALFLTGYAGLWLTLGGLVSVAFVALHLDRLPQPAFGAGALALAGLWQLVPARRRFATACHRTMPLSPRGWRADRDCLRYGLMIGRSCIASCGLLMLACVATGHSLAPMLALTAVGLYERYTTRPDETLLVALPLLMAVQFAFMPLISA